MSTNVKPGDPLSPHEPEKILSVSWNTTGDSVNTRDQEFATALSYRRKCHVQVLQILRGEVDRLEEWVSGSTQITIEKISGCAVEVLPYQGQKLYIVGNGRYLTETHVEILLACALELHSPSEDMEGEPLSEDEIKKCLRALTFLSQGFPHLSHDGRSFVDKFLKLDEAPIEASRIISEIRKIRKANKGATIEAVVDML